MITSRSPINLISVPRTLFDFFVSITPDPIPQWCENVLKNPLHDSLDSFSIRYMILAPLKKGSYSSL